MPEAKNQVDKVDITIRPIKVMNDLLGKEVVVVLKSGMTGMGMLRGFDSTLNLTLTDFKLLGSNHPLRPKPDQSVILRGDNILALYKR